MIINDSLVTKNHQNKISQETNPGIIDYII